MPAGSSENHPKTETGCLMTNRCSSRIPAIGGSAGNSWESERLQASEQPGGCVEGITGSRRGWYTGMGLQDPLVGYW